jgi:hypothetical protein
VHAVVRAYLGNTGAKRLFDRLEASKSDEEKVLGGVEGFVTHSLKGCGDKGFSVTVCQDKASTGKCIRTATE